MVFISLKSSSVVTAAYDLFALYILYPDIGLLLSPVFLSHLMIILVFVISLSSILSIDGLPQMVGRLILVLSFSVVASLGSEAGPSPSSLVCNNLQPSVILGSNKFTRYAKSSQYFIILCIFNSIPIKCNGIFFYIIIINP